MTGEATAMEQLLQLRAVMQMTSLGSSTIYRKIDKGEFPKPRKLGDNCVRWRLSDVQHWIERLPEAS
jgi:prophage regulatory protein